jgi:T5SS/PEP-CTERM-associated repeat protein
LISDGGTVFASNAIPLGFNSATSSNDLIQINGGTLRVQNLTGTGTLDIRSGTSRLDAGLVDADRLVMTNARGIFEFNGGTLITRGAFINNGTDFNVGNSGGTPAVWDVRAGASNHFVARGLYVGTESSFNQLILTNGALLTNDGFASVGYLPAARSNSATLAGAGSRWRLSDGVLLGEYGSGNRLVVSNGASLITDSHNYIGDVYGKAFDLRWAKLATDAGVGGEIGEKELEGGRGVDVTAQPPHAAIASAHPGWRNWRPFADARVSDAGRLRGVHSPRVGSARQRSDRGDVSDQPPGSTVFCG